MSEETRLNESLAAGTLREGQILQYFSHHSDIQLVTDRSIIAVYCAGMVDMAQFNEYYHAVLTYLLDSPNDTEKPSPSLVSIYSASDMVQKVLSGFLIFYKEGESRFYGLDIANIPQRKPEESKVDISIKGPKDAFTEELNVNISLIRKRLMTDKLYSETFSLGTLTKTKVSLLYLKNKTNPEIIREVEHRLKTFESESVVSAGQLEQWISNRTYSLFPLFDYITRPDYAVECLLRGRFVLVVGGSPMVLIGPANVFLLLKSPEDVHFPYYIVMFQRIFRLFGLIISIFLPGFWVAVSSVNLGQIPFAMIATITLGRDGIPFPVALEAILLLGFFELLREASLRMPTAIGGTVSIVGGLIIGDAAIRAGLASPPLIVIVSLTAVATYTLVNQSLTGTVTILRIYILVISSFLGVYGFFVGLLSIVVYLCRLESFKLVYIEPFPSLSFREYLSALTLDPFKRRRNTAKMIRGGKK